MALPKFIGGVPFSASAASKTLDSVLQVPATAAGAGIELVLGPWNSPNPPIIESITVIPQAAVAHDGANYVTMKITNRGSDGSGTAVLASANTTAVDLAAFIASTLTVDNTQAAVKPGDVLTFQLAKTGSGVATPPLAVSIDWRY